MIPYTSIALFLRLCHHYVEMPKQKYVEKNRRMCIRSKEKKDGKTVKTTKARSNFTFKPTIQVLGPKNGYIVQIKVFCNEAER